jgi:hypothetical protein
MWRLAALAASDSSTVDSAITNGERERFFDRNKITK